MLVRSCPRSVPCNVPRSVLCNVPRSAIGSTTDVSDYLTPFRSYDARSGRWRSHDPIFQPWESTYLGMGGNPAMMVDPWGLDGDTPEQPRGSIENPYQGQAVEVVAERPKVPMLSFATDLFGPPSNFSPNPLLNPLGVLKEIFDAAKGSFLNTPGLGTLVRDISNGSLADDISAYGQYLMSPYAFRGPNPLVRVIDDLKDFDPVEFVLGEVKQTAEDAVVLHQNSPERIGDL